MEPIDNFTFEWRVTVNVEVVAQDRLCGEITISREKIDDADDSIPSIASIL